MKLEKIKSEDELNEDDEYLVYRRDYIGEFSWWVMYFRNGFITEHPYPGQGNLKLTWEILQQNYGTQIYKLPYHGDD